MSKIEDIVDSLENRISKMLHKLDVLKQTNLRLSEELAQSEKNISEQERELVSWQEKYESLKLTNSILGSDEYKRETKLKINTLIREIDHCIAQLAE
jgi:phage shock protein A